MGRCVLASLWALIFWLACSLSAQAQDFSGTYFGGHIGYRWVDSDLTSPPYDVDFFLPVPARRESYSTDSIIVGGHLGHMIKIHPNWYIGVEADLSAGWGNGDRQASLGSINDEGGADTRSSLDTNWQGTIRGRLGYASGLNMIYVTGGFAFMDMDWKDAISINFGPTYTAQKSELLTGWVIGIGLERMLDKNWLVRAEYLYEDFGSMSVPLAGTTERGSLDVTAQKLRIGVSYKF